MALEINDDVELYWRFANDTTITQEDVRVYLREEAAIFARQPANQKKLSIQMFRNLPRNKVKLLFNAESEILEAAGAIVRE
jgi:hypothetical protein